MASSEDRVSTTPTRTECTCADVRIVQSFSSAKNTVLSCFSCLGHTDAYRIYMTLFPGCRVFCYRNRGQYVIENHIVRHIVKEYSIVGVLLIVLS